MSHPIIDTLSLAHSKPGLTKHLAAFRVRYQATRVPRVGDYDEVLCCANVALVTGSTYQLAKIRVRDRVILLYSIRRGAMLITNLIGLGKLYNLLLFETCW